MKQIIFDAKTGEVEEIEVADVEIPIVESEPTLDERVGAVEVTTDEIVDVLATIVGV